MKISKSICILEEGDLIEYIKSFNYELDYIKFEKLIYNIILNTKFNDFSYFNKRINSWLSEPMKNKIKLQNLCNNSMNKYLKKINFPRKYISKLFINNTLIGHYNKCRNIMKKWISILITFLIELFKKHNIKVENDPFNTELINIDISNIKISESKLFTYLLKITTNENYIILFIINILKKHLKRDIKTDDILLEHDYIKHKIVNDDYNYIDVEIIV